MTANSGQCVTGDTPNLGSDSTVCENPAGTAASTCKVKTAGVPAGNKTACATPTQCNKYCSAFEVATQPDWMPCGASGAVATTNTDLTTCSTGSAGSYTAATNCTPSAVAVTGTVNSYSNSACTLKCSAS